MEEEIVKRFMPAAFKEIHPEYKLDQWFPLGKEVMGSILCIFRNSSVVNSVLSVLVRNTLKDGVAYKWNLDADKATPNPFHPSGNPWRGKAQRATTDAVEFQPDAHERVMTALTSAIQYGLLFGMVPYTHDRSLPDGVRSVYVPPPDSGFFVAKMGSGGQREVGWRWNEKTSGTSGTSTATPQSSAHPSNDAGVFLWATMLPYVTKTAPFNSVMQRLMPELLRDHEMMENASQADWERTHPSFVVQPSPHRNAHTQEDDRRSLVVMFNDSLGDPSGARAGHGPGGSLTGVNAIRERFDVGSRQLVHNMVAMAKNLNPTRDQSIQVRINPCSGTAETVRRTYSWQRAPFPIPAGMVATSSVPTPAMRTDLLSQMHNTIRSVSMAMGVPPAFVFGGSSGPANSGGGSKGLASLSAGMGKSSRSTSSSAAVATSEAFRTLKTTVVAVREQLSAFYAEAHHFVVVKYDTRAVSAPATAVNGSIKDAEDRQYIERAMVLMGDTLANLTEGQLEIAAENKARFLRAVAVSERANAMWKSDLIRQRHALIWGAIHGRPAVGRSAGPDDMSIAAVNERRRHGKDMRPADYPGELLHPADQGHILARTPARSLSAAPPEFQTPSSKKRKRTKKATKGKKKKKKKGASAPPSEPGAIPYRDDPNAEAEDPEERRERLLQESGGLFGGTRTVMPGTGGTSTSSRYQRVPIPEIPDFDAILEKAEAIVERKAEMEKQRDAIKMWSGSISGRRGDTRLTLVWKGLPVPDLAMLQSLTMNGILPAKVMQRIVLADIGFDADAIARMPAPLEPAEIMRTHLAAEKEKIAASLAKIAATTAAPPRRMPKAASANENQRGKEQVVPAKESEKTKE